MSDKLVKGLKITFIVASLVGAAGQAYITGVENKKTLEALVKQTLKK